MASQELQTIADSFQPSFKLVAPEGAANQFIFSSPHSGRIYPRSFIENSALDGAQLRRSEDAYVDELFAHVADQGAHFIHSLVPRAYLDLNRHPYELDPKLFHQPLPEFCNSDSLKVKSGLGVIARIVAEGCEIYKEPLVLDEALTRINALYFPYHKALSELIEQVERNHQHAILIDCHSMPSANLPGFKRNPPDFVLGNLFDKSCDFELTHLVRAKLQGMGYHVSVNKPYAGGYVTKKYGKPKNGIHVMQIEINRALYLRQGTSQKASGFDELRNNLRDLTKNLMTTLPDLSIGQSFAAE